MGPAHGVNTALRGWPFISPTAASHRMTPNPVSKMSTECVILTLVQRIHSKLDLLEQGISHTIPQLQPIIFKFQKGPFKKMRA